MKRALLFAALLVTGACDEQTRVVGATPTPTVTAARTSSPPAATSAAPSASRTATPAATTQLPAPTTQAPAATSAPPAPTSSPARSSPPPAAGAQPVLGSCADEPSARPQPISATVPVVFSNQSGATRQYSSLDPQGGRVLARALANGTQYTQTAHIGDVWIVSSGGACVALYRVTAAALFISQAQRQSLIPLYAIAGIVTDARSGAGISGQSVFVWQPDESACQILGGGESPGAVVSSTTGTDGKYQVWVTPGDYKVRVRASAGYTSQWWSGKPALTAGHCAAADVVSITGDTLQVDFKLPPQ